ncbi:MAG: class I SAM-dependent methyltransferase [Promethearchaeota archaeon]
MIISAINTFFQHIKLISAKNRFINEIYTKNRAIISYIISFLSGIKLKREANKCKNIEDLIDLGLFFEYAPIKGLPFKLIFRTMQNRFEVTEFLNYIIRIKPKSILEIGTARGGTLFLLTRFSSTDANIISLDLPGGIHGGGYPRFRIPFFKTFVSKNQKLKLIRDNSHDTSTLKKIKKILKDHKLDLLFIDGDHTYEGVKKDFEMYAPLVKKNGIIAFHDIVVHAPEINCYVDKFWNEIKKNFNFREIYKEGDPRSLGIGIIKKN